MYMSSQSTNDGAYRLPVTFKLGMDFGHGPGAGAEPRLAGPAGDSGPGAERGHQRQEDLAQHDDDREPGLARRPLRRHLLEQLRHDLYPRRIGAAAGRGRHHLLRPARLQPAGLARSRQAGRPGAQRRRRRGRHRPAEPAGRRRPDRPGAGPQGPAIPADHQYPGPADRPGAVRRHHPQGRSAAAVPRRKRRAGGAGGSSGTAGCRIHGRGRRPGCRRPSASSAFATWPASSSARSSTSSRCTLDGKPSRGPERLPASRLQRPRRPRGASTTR